MPLLKNFSILGVFAGAWTERFPHDAARAAEKIMSSVAEGKLRPRIDRVLPLERAADALNAIAERSVQGRIVLQIR